MPFINSLTETLGVEIDGQYHIAFSARQWYEDHTALCGEPSRYAESEGLVYGLRLGSVDCEICIEEERRD